MSGKNPRFNVTFAKGDAELMQIICKKKNISLSGLVRKIVEHWIEDYEDALMNQRAKKLNDNWIDNQLERFEKGLRNSD